MAWTTPNWAIPEEFMGSQKDCPTRHPWSDLFDQPFPDQGKVDESEASDFAAGMRQGRHETSSDRIVDDADTIGMVSVACFGAAMIGVPLPTMRSGAGRTSSIA
jgi:hypothetical protein